MPHVFLMTPRRAPDIFHPSTRTVRIRLSILKVGLTPDFKEIYHLQATERDCLGTKFCVCDRENPASDQVGTPTASTQIFRVSSIRPGKAGMAP